MPEKGYSAIPPAKSAADAKKEKKDTAKKLKFKPDTFDAACLAFSRLSPTNLCCTSDLDCNDVLGYLFAIFLHIWASTIQIIATCLMFAFVVEYLEDPYETPTMTFVNGVLTQATNQMTHLNSTVFQGIPVTLKETSGILKLCAKSNRDIPGAKIVFLVMFSGIALQALADDLERMWMVICAMKPAPDLEDDEDEDENEGPGKNSLANDEQKNHFIEAMDHCSKFFMFLLFLVRLVFLGLIWWTFFKWLALIQDIMKIAKMCLKLGFLLNFVKTICKGYASTDLKKVLGDGGFKVPKPGKDTEGHQYILDTWLWSVIKLVICYGVTLCVYYGVFNHVHELNESCKHYGATMPGYPNLKGNFFVDYMTEHGVWGLF